MTRRQWHEAWGALDAARTAPRRWRRAARDPRAWRVGAMAPDESSRAWRRGEAARDAPSFSPRAGQADAATRVAEAARAAEPLLDMKQRTTLLPRTGSWRRRASRAYIGTWKHRYVAFLEDLPAPPPLPAENSGKRARRDARGHGLFLRRGRDALGRPELAGLPVAVSWSSGAKGAGELSSCNYEARARGCRAGGRVADALRRCPNLVVMPYEFEKYSAGGAAGVFDHARPHAARHEPGVSVDEAYLDVTALVGDPRGGGPAGGDGSRETATSLYLHENEKQHRGTAREVAETLRARIFRRNRVRRVRRDRAQQTHRETRDDARETRRRVLLPKSARETREACVASLPVRASSRASAAARSRSSAPSFGSRTKKTFPPSPAATSCARPLGPAAARARPEVTEPARRVPRHRPPGLGVPPAAQSVGAQVTWGVRFGLGAGKWLPSPPSWRARWRRARGS